MRAFAAVAREGSVGAAARRLFRTQPAVTMAIRALERDLGARLMERAGRGVRLTPEGDILLRLLEPVLEQIEGTAGRFREAVEGRLTGPLRVAADADGILYLLPPAIRALLRDHSEVNVMVAQHDPAEALALVRAGRVDVAVCRVDGAPEDLAWQRVLTADPILVAPRRLRLPRRPSLDWLVRQPLVEGPVNAPLTRRVEEAFTDRGLEPEVALAAENWETAKLYVGLGLGAAVVPAYCLQRHDRRISAAPARHLFGRLTHGAVTRKRAAPTAARLLVAELLKTRHAMVV